MNDTVSRDKVVYITYVIVDDNGAVLEQYDLPVPYLHGGRSGLLEKVEAALEGRHPGDRVEVSLSPEEGFGPHRPELTFTDDIENVPPEHRHLGSEVEFENERGERMLFRVSRIADGRLTIDGNHPLAGKRLTFLVRVESIRPATLDEIANAMAADSPFERMH
jgi:FKBP-type peptidyl-prolyl cis-trans isomerase SlyD